MNDKVDERYRSLWAEGQAVRSAIREENLETKNAEAHTERMDGTVPERVSALEGRHDGLKQSQTIMVAAVAMVGGLLVAGIAIVIALVTFLYQHVDTETAKLGTRIEAVDAKVDALPQKLDEQFRQMRQDMREDMRAVRQDMNAQTSTIANAVTAARAMSDQSSLGLQRKSSSARVRPADARSSD